MNITLHLSSFDFAKKINDIAFKQNKEPKDVEKKYYFNLLETKILEAYPKLIINISQSQFDNSFFTINGETQPIKESMWDWNCLCNFLYNSLKPLNLNFDFSQKEKDSKTIISAILYFNSVFDEQIKTISFDLFPATHSTSDNSSSGGNAQEKIKIDENKLNEFKKLPINQQVQLLKAAKSPVPIPKTSPLFNLFTAFGNSLKTIADVMSSVIKNNPGNLSTPKDTYKCNNISKTISNSKTDFPIEAGKNARSPLSQKTDSFKPEEESNLAKNQNINLEDKGSKGIPKRDDGIKDKLKRPDKFINNFDNDLLLKTSKTKKDWGWDAIKKVADKIH